MVEIASAKVRARIKGTSTYPMEMPYAKQARAYYEAASVSSSRFANWRTSGAGPNTLLSYSLPTLRDKSRDARRKNGLADNAIETWVSEAVGTGIKPKWTTKNKAFNKSMGDLWKYWTDEADAEGRLDYYGLQALALGSMMEAGDVFGRFRARRLEDGLSVPLQIQLLESDFCPSELNRTQAEGVNRIVCGVEFDRIGRRVNYHIYPEHPGENQYNVAASGTAQPIPAGEMFHLAYVRRAGSVRGEPLLSRALVKLYDLDTYDDAQLVRQKLAALFAGFIRPSVDGDNGMIPGMGLDPNEVGGRIGLASLEPGTMQVLEAGEEVEFSDPPSPGENYLDFVKSQWRYIAVSAGILYASLTGDYSEINDRSWRAAVGQFYKRVDRVQHNLVVFQMCRPTTISVVNAALASGKLTLPGDVSYQEAITPKWLGPSRPYINPLQDVNAKRLEVRSGFRARSDVVEEQGWNAEDIDAQILSDQDRADEMKLVFDTDARKVSAAGLTQVRPEGSVLPEE